MFPVIGLIFILELLVSVSGQSYYSRRCSSDRMRDCKDSIVRRIQKRVNDMSRQDMAKECGDIRSDFNCLLRETRCLTSESEKQSNGDILRKALIYLRDGCDTRGGGWKDSTCFIGDGMKNCESTYPLRSGQQSAYDTETCRKFNEFQECANHVMENRCVYEDQKLLSQYLVDRYQDLSWNCPEADSDRSRDRVRDREGDRDYSRYDSSSDRYGSDRGRDRDRDQWRSQSDRGSDRDSDRGSDRGYSDRYGSDRYSDRYDSSGRNYHSYRNGGDDITCCRNERCDNSRMRRCRDSLTATVDNRNGGYQDEKKCRKVRDDFNCLLWQTTCLPREDRDRANDIFHRARDYISRYCDTYSRWSENSCYKSSDMQVCETKLSTSRAGASYESCRAYNDFRNCMEEELRRRCTREDDLLQGAYLVEKAQEMSWQCGNENSGTRSQFNDPYRDDRYDRNDRRSGGYDSQSYGSYQDPQHLDDDDAICLSRMQSAADNCRNDMTNKRSQLQAEVDYDVKQKRHCCSAIEFRRCLYDASRRICMQERGRVVEQLLGRQRYEMNSDNCRKLYDRDCNAGSIIQVSAVLLFSMFISLLLHL